MTMPLTKQRERGLYEGSVCRLRFRRRRWVIVSIGECIGMRITGDRWACIASLDNTYEYRTVKLSHLRPVKP